MENKRGNVAIIAIIIVIMAITAGVVGWMFANKSQDKVQQQSVDRSVSTSASTSSGQSKPIAVEQKKESTQVVVAANCDEFPDNLKLCAKYKCQFTHPFTGEKMQKEILGIINGKCDYIEQLPNNGKMECKYTESQRVVAAQYYRDTASAKSSGTNVEADLGSGERKVTYTLDGKIVSNPLQDFIDNKTCLISGY